MQARPSMRSVQPVQAAPVTSVGAPTIERDAPISPPAWEVTEPERRSMVSEAAYYRSAARGFAPGYELEDWLAAEAEIEALLQLQGAGMDRD